MPRSNPFTVSRNQKLTREEINRNIRHFAETTISVIPCVNQKSNRRTACRCFEVFSGNDPLVDKLVALLQKFEKLSGKERQLFLHGVLTHGFIEKDRIERGKKRTPTFLLPSVSIDGTDLVKLCNNGLRNLFCIGSKQWNKLSTDAALPPAKDTSGYNNNTNNTLRCAQDVIDFLYAIGEEEGEAHATRQVRIEFQTCLRDSDLDLVQLPPCYSKRQLYQRFCYEKGWIAKCNAKGTYPPINQLKRRPFDDENEEMALWPTGSIPGEVCSWRSFLRTWNTYLPFLKIRSPAHDTCVSCNIFRNRSKYLASRDDRENEDASETSLYCPTTNEESLLKRPVDGVFSKLGGAHHTFLVLKN